MKKSIFGLVTFSLVTVATIIVFIRGLALLGFLLGYEAIILTIFIRIKKLLLDSNMYRSFAKFFLKNEYSVLLIILGWIFIDFFLVISFLLFNYILSCFIISSIIQLIMDFILTFGIIPSIIRIFKQ